MEHFEDSPKKKKARKNETNSNLECILHIRKDCKSEKVTAFSAKSWKVRLFRVFLVLLKYKELKLNSFPGNQFCHYRLHLKPRH